MRGGGDLATGVIYYLAKAGYRVLVLETLAPAAIRRKAAFCEAVYDGSTQVEGMTAVGISCVSEADKIWELGQIPVLVDPKGNAIQALKPQIVVDAILAKKNLGTYRGMAPFTVGLGPGFTAGKDVDIVIETMRGHDLGRIITEGPALPDTGVPGNIGGYTSERVIHSPAAGKLYGLCRIGDLVKKGQEIAYIVVEKSENNEQIENPKRIAVTATISGVLRGLIRDGYPVTKGFKIADIDPRLEQQKNCYTISDKSRCIAGAVLMAVCGWCAKTDCK